MHVLQLFDPLPVAPDVEIVKAQLPEARQRVVTASKAKPQLRG
jgi:hypothetical protein